MENASNIFVGKYYRFTILSEMLVRMEYSPSGKFLDEATEFARNRSFPMPKFNIQQDSRYLVIETKYFKLEYIKEKPFYGTKFVPEQNLKVFLKNTDKYWFFGHVEARNFKTIGYSLDDKENIKLDTKGLYSTDGFVSIDDSESLIIKDDKFYQRGEKQIDTYLFMYRRDFGLALRDYFTLTGKPTPIPRFMFGNIWNKNRYYTDRNIEELINKFNKNDIPINAIILGNDWHSNNGKEYGLSWNNDLFIEFHKFMDYLKLKNIHLGVTINPTTISTKEKNFEAFVKDAELTNENDINLNVYNKKIIDSYFNNFIDELNNNGIDCFIIDYNDIKDPYTLRVLNYYHALFFKNKKLKNGILSRNGFINSHLTNVVYTGKTYVSWKVLNTLPEYNSSACNKGISYISSDIGGYYGGIEDDELFRRYVQLGTYSTMMRLSSDSSHFYKREPWLWDMHTLSIVSYYLRLRSMLIPYLYTESNNYNETGLPIIQPLYYNYPNIYDEPEYKNEYYFGKSLFVCPITSPKDPVMNRTIQRIFLPSGIWYDFKTGIKYAGNRRYIVFYKDEDYPVFATKGSIIPLAMLNDDNLNSSKNPDGFEIHIFPGQGNIYTIYEDDGITLNKENYFKTIVDYNYMLNNYTVIIRQDYTDPSLVPEIRSYKIKFRNTRKPNDVTVHLGQETITDFESYNDENDFVIEINRVSTFKQIIINCKGQDIEIDIARMINSDFDSIITDLKIKTVLKTEVSKIIFDENMEIKTKRIEIRKLKKKGLSPKHINMFLKLLEYLEENV